MLYLAKKKKSFKEKSNIKNYCLRERLAEQWAMECSGESLSQRHQLDDSTTDSDEGLRRWMGRGCLTQARCSHSPPGSSLLPTHMGVAHRPEDAPTSPSSCPHLLLEPWHSSQHSSPLLKESTLPFTTSSPYSTFFQSSYHLAEVVMIALSCFFSTPSLRVLSSLFFV